MTAVDTTAVHPTDARSDADLTPGTAIAPPPDAAPDAPREIAAIEALLASKDVAGAGPRLAAALERWPGEVRLHFLSGEHLAATGRPAEAEAVYAATVERFPANAWAPIRLVRQQLASGDAARARETFARLVWSDEPAEPALPLLTQLTTATTDAATRQAFLDGLLRGTPADRFVIVKLATLAFRRHDKRAAARLFDEAAALGPLPAESGVLQLELLVVEARFDEALALALALMARHPERTDLMRKAIQAAFFANRSDELVRLLQAAIARWPDDWFTLFRYNRSAAPFDIDRALYLRLAEREAAMAADERWSFQFAVAALRHQDSGRALAILDRLDRTGPVAHMSEPLRRAFAARPASAWANPRAVSNDPAADVQVIRAEGARAILVVFAGVQNGFSYVPFSHADGLFADHPLHVVYLRDRRNRSFGAGVEGLGRDEADSIAALRHLRDTLGGLPMVTTGSSVGGVAAARYGALCGARAVISFAAPVHLRDDASLEDDPVSRTNYRGAMLTALAGNDDRLLDVLAAATETRIHQCYGTGYAPDVATAELMRPLANVDLVPVEGCADHFVLEHMIADGSFDGLFRRVVDEIAGG
jgi:tetratricopeptide (TPR) repeat protein